ncbi:TAP-like protein-domain-containing protein [Mycena albidolilacea]|uniref:TAP-like protein-domain-containing protein n=1 Tax=Mycena albidolilacea TaxID=1033008 RepID=A0AAD6ZLR7_9AGAR|nr:TAP-like protein-domain-containing protein [Mycena albidolilacea]
MIPSFLARLAVAGLLISNVLADSEFDWETLTATASLNWTSCYTGFECSLLEVPLDYSADKGNASIAVVRYPSTAPKSEYLGPILFNPGGPGGSGVTTIVALGAEFAEIFGNQFDIVGFDPRGVSFSKPAVSFFKTAAERQSWTAPDLDFRYPSLNASAGVIPNVWGQFQLIGQLAEERDTDDVLQYITTDNVARDMLRISQAFGYEKLQYWGVSYGSLLGATFATLFPNNVGRIAIDGIMDWEAWYSSNLTGSLQDTDKTLQTFFDGCVAAGPSACAFYAPSSAEIAANLAALTESIRAQPFPVKTDISHGLVDFTFFRNYIFAALYSPYNAFAGFAQGLAALASGNATGVYAANQAPEFECDCSVDRAPFTENIYESLIATSCGDGPQLNDSISDLRAFYERQTELSSFADIWGLWRIHCTGWKVHRPGRFQGPVGGNTSFPLLVIGNTADPVTPLAWAHKASAAFPGSVVLTQDTPGHMSLVAPSLCTHGALRAYFQNGTLPAAGTVCEPDASAVLFPGAPNATANTSTTNAPKTLLATAADGKLLDAVRKIGNVVRPIAAMGRPL